MTSVVAFVSQKGGVGKSTLARALATLASESGISVRLADVDWRQQTAKHWADLRNETGVEPAVDCLVYDNALNAIEDAHDVDLLVIDQPGYASEQTVELAQHADLIIEPTGPSIDDMRPGMLALHELVEAGIAQEKLAVALFRVATPAEERRARAYMGEYGYGVLDGYLPEMVSLRQSQDEGHSVFEGKTRRVPGPTDELMTAMISKLTERMDEWKSRVSVNENQRMPVAVKDREAKRGARAMELEREDRER